MIVTLSPDLDPARLEALLHAHPGLLVEDGDERILVLPSGVRELDPDFADFESDVLIFDDDRQLSHPGFRAARTVRVAGEALGRAEREPDEDGRPPTLLISGPCSAESEAQVREVAQRLVHLGLKAFRGGAYKPRTSPYSFQGLGREGLQMMRRVCDEHDLALVTEVRDATHVDDVIELADVIQVGAKSMYDHGVLRACGRTRKPVLLKRGFGSTLQELAQAAEFILSGGNGQVMLCERGVRTFETKTRFTLDLCGVAWLKRATNLPVIVDPSHAIGYAWGVPDLACAAMAMGVDGLLIEAHPDPSVARSDAAQQLDLDALAALVDRLGAVAGAIGRRLA